MRRKETFFLLAALTLVIEILLLQRTQYDLWWTIDCVAFGFLLGMTVAYFIVWKTLLPHIDRQQHKIDKLLDMDEHREIDYRVPFIQFNHHGTLFVFKIGQAKGSTRVQRIKYFAQDNMVDVLMQDGTSVFYEDIRDIVL